VAETSGEGEGREVGSAARGAQASNTLPHNAAIPGTDLWIKGMVGGNVGVVAAVLALWANQFTGE
jgi:hypothetical protein